MSYTDLVKKYELELNKDIDELYSRRGNEISEYEKDPKIIYQYFKTFTAIGEFYFARHQYQCDSILANDEPGEDDYTKINAELMKLGKVSDNLKLKHPPTAKKLLSEAESAFIEGTIYENDDAELMVYSLFKSDFFEKYPLPHISLCSSDCSGKKEYIFMIVYAKYILLYDYLVAKLPVASLTGISPIIPTKKAKTKKGTALELESFKDMFKDLHKDKFDEVIKLLSSPLPPRLTKKFTDLEHPFVNLSGNVITWNNDVDSPVSYIIGIYIACKPWLYTRIPQGQAAELLGKTFDVKIKSRTAFRNSKKFVSFQEKYIEPFKILFETIK